MTSAAKMSGVVLRRHDLAAARCFTVSESLGCRLQVECCKFLATLPANLQLLNCSLEPVPQRLRSGYLAAQRSRSQNSNPDKPQRRDERRGFRSDVFSAFLRVSAVES